jgi:phosphatidylglycerophosphate synthase
VNGNHPNYFGKADKKYFDMFAHWRTKAIHRLVPVLDFFGMTPDLISYIALSMMFPVVFIFLSHPILATFLILFGIFLDGIDGAYARNKQAQSERGAIVDILCDQIGMGIIAISSIYYGLLDPAWGMYYVFIYLLMICLILYQNMHDISVQLHMRTKYMLFLIYFVYAFSGKSYMNLFIPMFAVIQTYTVLQSSVIIWRHRKKAPVPIKPPSQRVIKKSGLTYPDNPVVMKIGFKGYLVGSIVLIAEILLIILL